LLEPPRPSGDAAGDPVTARSGADAGWGSGSARGGEARGGDAGEAPAIYWDLGAGALSVACAVHCACAPLLVSAAPLLVTPSFEVATTVGLMALSLGVVLRGALRHGSYATLALLVVGFGALVLRLSGDACCRPPAETRALLVISTAGLLGAHALNARCLLRCRSSCGSAADDPGR